MWESGRFKTLNACQTELDSGEKNKSFPLYCISLSLKVLLSTRTRNDAALYRIYCGYWIGGWGLQPTQLVLLERYIAAKATKTDSFCTAVFHVHMYPWPVLRTSFLWCNTYKAGKNSFKGNKYARQIGWTMVKKEMLSGKLNKKKENFCTVSFLRSSAAVHISWTVSFYFLMDVRSVPQNLFFPCAIIFT
jgi:hypothetical protein